MSAQERKPSSAHRNPVRSGVVAGALLALALGAAASVAACEPHLPRVEIATGAATSAARGLAVRTQALTLDMYTRDGTLLTYGFGLTLLGEADAPVLDGVVLQATDVQWMGSRVFATYNVQGDPHRGALQVIDAAHPDRPVVLAEALYRDTDLNRLRVAGSNVYVAAADGLAGGTVEHFTFTAGELAHADWLPLGSYSGTFLTLDGYRAWATTGDVGGGVHALDLSGAPLLATASLPLHDARWVGTPGGRSLAAVSGSPGTLTVWSEVDADPTPGAEAPAPRQVPIDGARIGAPTWAQVHRGHLYISSDDAGLLVYDLETLAEVGRLPTDGNTNGLALSVDGKLAFLANGEEGLVMADVMDPARPVVLAALDRLDDGGSANAVSVRGNLLALADGLGGVKLLRYERRAHAPAGDCDGDGRPDGADADDDDDGVLDADDEQPCNPDAACAEDRADHVAAFVREGAGWRTTLLASEPGRYTLALPGEGDGEGGGDARLFVDGTPVRAAGEVDLTAGAHAVELRFAAGRTPAAAPALVATGRPSPTARVELVQHVCLAPDGDEDGDGVRNDADVAPLEPPPGADGGR